MLSSDDHTNEWVGIMGGKGHTDLTPSSSYNPGQYLVVKLTLVIHGLYFRGLDLINMPFTRLQHHTRAFAIGLSFTKSPTMSNPGNYCTILANTGVVPTVGVNASRLPYIVAIRPGDLDTITELQGDVDIPR